MVTENPRERKYDNSHIDTTLKNIFTFITSCIKDTVNTDEYIYSITDSTKKMRTGSFVINVRISLKSDRTKYKYLVFVVNRDDKTGLYHTFILDSNIYVPNILFSTTDKNPVNKLIKYLPSIINSTQNMLK